MSDAELRYSVEILKIGALSAAMWIFFFRLVRAYRIDAVRQRLFIVRDNLFDVAARGGVLSFDDPAYGMVRKTINGYIRFAHRMGFIEVILAVLAFRNDPGMGKTLQRFRDATERLPIEAQRIVGQARAEAAHIVLWHITTGNPFLLPVAGIIALLFRKRTSREATTPIAAPGMKEVETEAQIIGSQNWAPPPRATHRILANR